MNQIVVIGNGMVGHRLCERLAENGVAAANQIIVLGEERRAAYDRVNLTAFFQGKSAANLALTTPKWYRDNGITLYTGVKALRIDRAKRVVCTACNSRIPYDHVVLATGSYPFVPDVPGMDRMGVFVYRTLEDLEDIRQYAQGCKRAAVMGGGLLGLEAAKALLDLGLETSVVEHSPRLMARQLDQYGADLLQDRIQALGVSVYLNRATEAVVGNGRVTGLRFSDGSVLDADMVVVSAGIRPRDEVARASGLSVALRGGVMVDDYLRTSDPSVFAIGEAASHNDVVYGLVAPGYQMADALAATLAGAPKPFLGSDLSAKLKLMGVEVASFGDAFAPQETARTIEFRDSLRGIYKKLVVSLDGARLLGGMLVGETSEYTRFLHYTRSGETLAAGVEGLLGGAAAGARAVMTDLGNAVQVCSCNNVTKGQIAAAIRDEGITALGALKTCTKAGTGCGGCVPLLQRILDEELRKQGHAQQRGLCPHFGHSRQELFQIVKVKRYRTFQELLVSHGRGNGCEICKPAVASILASLWNEFILNEHNETLQDTNDRFLANIQRGGSYSVVPRVPGGEITPEKLIAIGQVAQKFGLYAKITGGQRIDLFGAAPEQLPAIWSDLVAAGFESGHAYGKAVRTVKSCVGSTWCRFGVQDSVSFAIRVEDRYKGIRAPHKIKMAVSGCVRECAEAQSKDIGLIATERGWNLYVCGNGGAKPRHADLFAMDLDENTAIRYIDRFLMYYIYTADKLTRTATWLEGLEGGLEHLRNMVINDSLGICEQLEADIDRLISSYRCEWAEVVQDPEKQKRFLQLAQLPGKSPYVIEREQKRPAAWPREKWQAPAEFDEASMQWVRVGQVSDFPQDGGAPVNY
ncbi:MAG: nitrite reductase large subunit, partial [Candidatus Hydrogenedentes bacterium]|nr:nitrite reductase large subunit [Candidatus Hydrogenedentota bacterium]